MAPSPADLSPPGSATYSSDNMYVGDGTWDFTKNSFLLPNLVGLNFDTMQYNGMGNRFSTLAQYHTLVLAHGVLATMAFLFLIPTAVMMARFYTGRPGFAIRYHAYLNVLAVGLTTVAFILGWFAVGPSRSLTNPHHGIGVAIYVLILLQAIGGRMVKHIRGRSIRVTVHQWSGRAIALLGIVQVPLGLTLYGSPRYCFILYALWMTTLLLIYFVLSYRAEGRREEYYVSGVRSEGGRSRVATTHKTEGGGSRWKWLGPLAAGAGAFALFRRKKERSRSRSRAASRSRSRSRMRSHSRVPEVIPSRRGSHSSYVEDEKYSERRKESGGGGIMGKVMGVGAALGAGALLSRFMKRKDKDRRDDAEYSAVSTDTPSRHSRPHGRPPPPRRDDTMVSEVSEDTSVHGHGHGHDRPRTPVLPRPGDPVATAAAMSAAAPRPGAHRPMTPPRSHRRDSRPDDSFISSDYSSYRSPSRRTPPKSGGAAGGIGKGLLAGLGVGWFAKKMKDRRDKKEEERLRQEEDDRRGGSRPPRYTGDGYGSPSRRPSRRPSTRPGASGRPTVSAVSGVTESTIEPRPPTGYGPPPGAPPVPVPMPAPVPGVPPGNPAYGAPPPPPTAPPGPERSRSRSRHDVEQVSMPSMPPDPFMESGSEAYHSSGGRTHRRHSSRRRMEGEAAAAAAVASASRLAVDEDRRRQQQHGRSGSRGGDSPGHHPVSVKVKVHDDRDRNVTLRRLTEEEARREARRRNRAGSTVSSLSGGEGGGGGGGPSSSTPGGGSGGSGGRQRYRRDSSLRRAEAAAERRVEAQGGYAADDPLAPLSPPNPAFAGGRRPAGKDSAYYSGPAGAGLPPGPPPTPGGPSSYGGQPPPPPSGPTGHMPAAAHTVSSLGSPGSYGGSPAPSGAMGPGDSTASAAERRRRRRLERRDTRPQGSGVEYT